MTKSKGLVLNEAQVILLELFQHKQMTPDDLIDLRKTLVTYLDKRLEDEVEQAMQQKGISMVDLEKSIEAMSENRTQYLNRGK